MEDSLDIARTVLGIIACVYLVGGLFTSGDQNFQLRVHGMLYLILSAVIGK